jgi:hypothetical protein
MPWQAHACRGRPRFSEENRYTRSRRSSHVLVAVKCKARGDVGRYRAHSACGGPQGTGSTDLQRAMSPPLPCRCTNEPASVSVAAATRRIGAKHGALPNSTAPSHGARSSDSSIGSRALGSAAAALGNSPCRIADSLLMMPPRAITARAARTRVPNGVAWPSGRGKRVPRPEILIEFS